MSRRETERTLSGGVAVTPPSEFTHGPRIWRATALFGCAELSYASKKPWLGHFDRRTGGGPAWLKSRMGPDGRTGDVRDQGTDIHVGQRTPCHRVNGITPCAHASLSGCIERWLPGRDASGIWPDRRNDRRRYSGCGRTGRHQPDSYLSQPCRQGSVVSSVFRWAARRKNFCEWAPEPGGRAGERKTDWAKSLPAAGAMGFERSRII